MSDKMRPNQKYPDVKIGDTFNEWTVIDNSIQNSKHNFRQALCRCSCLQTEKIIKVHTHLIIVDGLHDSKINGIMDR